MLLYLPLFCRDGTFWTEESMDSLEKLAVAYEYEQELCGAVEIDTKDTSIKLIEKGEVLYIAAEERKHEEKEPEYNKYDYIDD